MPLKTAEEYYSPRQSSDFGSFGLVVCRGEVSEVAKILDDALGERGAEGAKFILGYICFTSSNQSSVIGSRVIGIKLLVQVCIRLLAVGSQAVKVELDELRDALAVLASDAGPYLSQE